jgi:hypothetical protein
MMGVSRGAFPPIASNQPLDSGRNCSGKNCKTRQNTRINLAMAKFLPQQTRLMYFLAVAQDDAICTDPLKNFPVNRRAFRLPRYTWKLDPAWMNGS